MKPPLPAILLTAAGALPFAFAAAMALALIPGDGRALGLAYGGVILAFMSGVLWGFAARRAAWWPYGAAVAPALYLFFTVPEHPWTLPGQPVSHLIAGFLGVLVLDAVFQACGMAPRWWLTLRIPATAVVVACLWVLRSA